MLQYWLGLIFALLASMLHAGANILDGIIVGDNTKPLGPIIFLYSALNTLSLPIICLLDFPKALPLDLLGIVGLIASIEVLYQYPYLHALRAEETSVVTALFSLGKFLTPLFALVVLRESLGFTQYLGFALIVSACAALAFDFTKFRPHTSWWWMLIVSSLLSLQAVLYKYAFANGAGLGTVVLWSTVLELAITSSILVYSRKLHFLRGQLAQKTATVPLVALGQLLTFGGTIVGLYSFLFVPVSVSNGLQEFQGVFVLILGLILSNNYQHPKPPGKHIGIKLLLMLVAGVGAWFLAVHP